MSLLVLAYLVSIAASLFMWFLFIYLDCKTRRHHQWRWYLLLIPFIICFIPIANLYWIHLACTLLVDEEKKKDTK